MAQVALALEHADDARRSFDGPAPALQDGPDRTGFELGWDFARHGLVPPVAHLAAGNPLRQGWEAGRASVGPRTLRATPAVRTWLQLRTQAWQQGRAFEGLEVTPHFLAQIDSGLCPVTRLPLTRDTGEDSDAVVERVYQEAGYAAGNLAMLSRRAQAAKAALRWDEAQIGRAHV